MLSDALFHPLDLEAALKDADDDAEVASSHADLGEGAAALEVLRRQYPVASRPRRVQFRAAYLPATAHATARQRGLFDATVQRDHESYRRELQIALRGMAEARPEASIVVAPIDVDGLVAYARREGLNPAVRSTRLAYSKSVVDLDRDVTWPPERNGPCWCGSGRKYKKCCGAPAFTAVAPPDPASVILRIDLDRVRPSVWRRIAAPSNLRLDEVHRLIQAAMGWHEEHTYAFDDGEVTITAPGSEESERPADTCRLVTVAGEVGLRFGYVYDFGERWEHTVTVEEIREAGPVNVAEILDGAGACPPEACGGPHRYMALVKALRDTADPNHDDAVELLGLDYDAGVWQDRDGRSG